MILTPPIIHPLPYTVLIFDADSTLRYTTVPGQPCPNDHDQWAIMPRVVETLSLYQWQTVHFFGIASNQGGVALGFLTQEKAHNLLVTLGARATGIAWSQRALQLCPHLPQDRCVCRKPLGAMLEAVEMYWYSQAKIHGPGQCLFVGDQESDRDAAAHASIDFCWARDFFGWIMPDTMTTPAAAQPYAPHR